MFYEILDTIFFLERITTGLITVVGIPLLIVYGLVVMRSQHRKNQLQIRRLEEREKEK